MSGSRGHRLDTLKTRRLAAGLSVFELARRANLTDWLVTNLEDGGNCDPNVTQRILDALANPVAITSNSQASPSVVTTTTAHNLVTGDTVTIAGVADSDADINGTRVVTVASPTTFSVPVNAGTSAGTGGTVALSATSVGIARL